MTDRLQKALLHINELPAEMQDEVAGQIEDMLSPRIDLPTYAGAIPDLPDDMEEELMRRRRQSTPTPPLAEQLKWLDDETA